MMKYMTIQIYSNMNFTLIIDFLNNFTSIPSFVHSFFLTKHALSKILCFLILDIKYLNNEALLY